MFRTKLKTSISNINIGTKTNTMNHIHLVGAPNVWMESMVLLVLVLVLILWPFIPYVSKRLDLKVGGDEFSKGLMIIVDHVWWCKSTSLPMTWCVAWFRMMYTSMKVWSWQVAWYNVQQWQRLVPQDISNINNQMGNNKSGACIIIVPYRHNYKWHDMSFGLGMILLFTKAWPWHVTWHGMQVAWCHWLTKVEPHDIWQIQNQ